MFRIRKTFENSTLAIFIVEGKITDEQVNLWSQEIHLITQRENDQLILNFCSLAFISAEALRVLTNALTNRIYIMNSSLYVRNLLKAAGCFENLLD